MKPEEKDPEKGQIIIILALVIIVLMGFAGLAIDGGMIYSDRRNEQNAADAGSLAGAGAAAEAIRDRGNQLFDENWTCASAEGGVGYIKVPAENASIDSSMSNNFVINKNNLDNGVGTYCHDGGDNYYDVAVTITKQTQTSFAQLILNHPMINVVHATSRVYPRVAFGAGNAIISLNDDFDCTGQDKGMVFGGNITVTVDNGTIFSNSCIQSNGLPGQLPKVYTEVPGGYVRYSPPGYVSNPPSQVAIDPPPVYDSEPFIDIIPSPKTICDARTTTNIPGNPTSLTPGRYGTLFVNNSQTLDLAPGLYCINDKVVVNGGGTLTGDHVTFFLYGAGPSDPFQVNGGATVQLTAPPADCLTVSVPYDGNLCTQSNPAVPGVLIYYEGYGKGVTLSGNGSSNYTGTVYVPHANLTVVGTDDFKSINAQLIGWNVKINGTSTMNVIYDADTTYHVPVRLQLHR